MNGEIQTVSTGTCPICYSDADSPHHIKPLSAGGKDEPKNKVWLCKRCHDIVEMVYNETGLEYSPALVHHIRREFNLGVQTRQGLTRPKCHPAKAKKSVFRVRESRPEKEAYPLIGTCVLCGCEFTRTRSNQATCRGCARKRNEKPFAILAWSTRVTLFVRRNNKMERVYVSTVGELFRIDEKNSMCSVRHNRIPELCLRNKQAREAFLASMRIGNTGKLYLLN